MTYNRKGECPGTYGPVLPTVEGTRWETLIEVLCPDHQMKHLPLPGEPGLPLMWALPRDRCLLRLRVERGVISHHCRPGGPHEPACLGFYSGEHCDCPCHVTLEPRKGWMPAPAEQGGLPEVRA